jgi:hypothetical protein
MEGLDLKTILDAGGIGVLLVVLFISSKKIDRLIDSFDKLLGQLIEIIGRDTAQEVEERRLRRNGNTDHKSGREP